MPLSWSKWTDEERELISLLLLDGLEPPEAAAAFLEQSQDRGWPQRSQEAVKRQVNLVRADMHKIPGQRIALPSQWHVERRQGEVYLGDVYVDRHKLAWPSLRLGQPWGKPPKAPAFASADEVRRVMGRAAVPELPGEKVRRVWG